MDVETHFRNEYGTFGWILTGMLERAGFVVGKIRSDDDFMTEYVCRKARGTRCKEKAHPAVITEASRTTLYMWLRN